jgi:transposase-like protein
MAIRISNDVRKDIQQRLESGETRTEIAHALNINYLTVCRNTRQRRNLTKSQVEEIIERAKSGENISSISELFSVGTQTIRKYTIHLRKTDVAKPLQTLESITPEIRTEFVKRIQSGESANELARELKVAGTTARKLKTEAVNSFELTINHRTKIAELRSLGNTFGEIAKQIEIPRVVVFNYCGSHSGVRYSDAQRQAAIAAVEGGELPVKVANRLRISPATIHEWFESALAAGRARRPEKPLEKRDDHEFEWITRRYPSLEEWRKYIVAWLQECNPSANTAVAAVSAFVEKYLIGCALPSRPADLLKRGLLLPDFYKTACPQSVAGRAYAQKIHELIEWVLDSPEFADTESEEPIRLIELFRNPVAPQPKGRDEPPRSPESTKVVLPYFLISSLRKQIAQGPSFKDWEWVRSLGGIDTLNGQSRAGDWVPVPDSLIDKTDSDCVWRLRSRGGNEPVLEMWSPVRWVHALVHLQTTTRGGQLRMVDSGEADTYVWNGSEFVINDGPLRSGTRRAPRQQGIFRMASPEDIREGVSVSLYFNSNKTADRSKVRASKGFECPWPRMPEIEEDPYYWLAKLRSWQIKYNPINKLTGWGDLRGHAKMSAMTTQQAASYPDTAFLFRAPENLEHPNWPVFASQCKLAWRQLLSSYESLLAAQGVTHPSGQPLQLIDPETGNPWSSPHSTRVSLITHLIIDGGVSPIIMMKVAGHARFIMTIYYTKLGPASIHDALKRGADAIERTKAQTFERDLLNERHQELRKKVVFNSEAWRTVIPINPADRNPLGWLHLHDGICLAGGNNGTDPSEPGCHSGGSVLAGGSKARPKYGPVPGGIRNCCRCRWKASGKQHLLGLSATYNNRSFHLHKAKQAAISAERTRNALLQDKARQEAEGKIFDGIRSSLEAQRLHESAMQRFQELSLDIVALDRTIRRVVALPVDAGQQFALAAQGGELNVKAIVTDTDSDLLQLAGICEDVALFPDLDPGTAVFELSRLLDNAFEREHHPVILARLSADEQLIAVNAVMREFERLADSEDYFRGRIRVVHAMDREDSLEALLGVGIQGVLKKVGVGGPRLVISSEVRG